MLLSITMCTSKTEFAEWSKTMGATKDAFLEVTKKRMESVLFFYGGLADILLCKTLSAPSFYSY